MLGALRSSVPEDGNARRDEFAHREKLADERDRLADERDAVAYQRDVDLEGRTPTVDMREQASTVVEADLQRRGAAADRRDVAAAARERAADDREPRADERQRLTVWTVSLAFTVMVAGSLLTRGRVAADVGATMLAAARPGSRVNEALRNACSAS